uniref:DUF4220 domain-containing protein n=2 Tax=Setaria italica TaxID=4555 RepID=A0A0Q3P1P9_SETIT
NKHSYHRADIAVTYSLFIGGFFLDFCAIFISLRSPWTWLWLKARGCNMLARFSWFLFSNDAIGWSEKRTLRSIVAGQYNLRGWLVHTEQPRSFFSPLMMTVRKSLTLCGAQEDKIFWLSKILGWEYAKGDKIMECLQSKMYGRWYSTGAIRSVWDEHDNIMECIQGFVGQRKKSEPNDFGYMLVYMHIQTEAHLREDLLSHVESTVCRQLSRYMMYLLVTHPSLLPLDTSAVATLDWWRAAAASEGMSRLERMNPWLSSTEALKELVDFWVWVIMYAAAKSRSEMHAALLARGSGELLTFVWLMMAHHLKTGDFSDLSIFRKIDHRDFTAIGVFGQRF